MEIEELKKIWDSQNDKPMYIINEEALHRSIKRSKKKASIISDLNEYGLILIALLTVGFVLLKNGTDATIYTYLPAIVLLLSCFYILAGRLRRKKNEKQYGRSVLGDLD
ncbi:MAG: hypothetical protein WBA74_13865, partial [Cyclobacteriaceae bacterium]